MQIDTIGLNCPLPVIKAEKALSSLSSGDLLVLLASDPLAAIDIPNMCNKAGHKLLAKSQTGDVLRFEIEKA
ncbi:sulfurtransferase TusA family protein [Maritalea porphyrae]|jgi:tRNA 2-thiouridine synthesizing protein A|uniref:sulfurtransferase TusA family protein n=1 Tax=Maritalea porphyrae TaxID=880732 RepID=UPI0022AE74FF|nr:sulfurtransferase TusA family protein [Maritalea porphyrae]MCZ4273944.1 sulfurtransferase TusA family protein [Maritalea porphyrae]